MKRTLTRSLMWVLWRNGPESRVAQRVEDLSLSQYQCVQFADLRELLELDHLCCMYHQFLLCMTIYLANLQ